MNNKCDPVVDNPPTSSVPPPHISVWNRTCFIPGRLAEQRPFQRVAIGKVKTILLLLLLIENVYHSGKWLYLMTSDN
jgi:hypothetical protein